MNAAECWRRVGADSWEVGREGRNHRDVRDERRPRCRSLIQANTISVTVQQDHITHSHYCCSFIYPDTHTRTFLLCHISCRGHVSLKSDKWLSKHAHAHGLTQITPFLECGTHERTSLNAHSTPSVLPPPLLVPLSSGSPWIQPLGLPSHIISGCVSLQTIWALRGLVDPTLLPWRACCLRGIWGHLVIFSAVAEFLPKEWKKV